MSSLSNPLKLERPFWPPLWNPFQVFILALAMISSTGLIGGSSGSKALDDRLDDSTVTAWGICLFLGAAVALFGLWNYSRLESLMPGLYLERAGCILVGVACAIYVVVVIKSAAELNDARYTAAVNTGFAAACFYRARQDHRVITRALKMAGKQPWRELARMVASSFRRMSGGGGQ